jgi:hypothetical protein
MRHRGHGEVRAAQGSAQLENDRAHLLIRKIARKIGQILAGESRWAQVSRSILGFVGRGAPDPAQARSEVSKQLT